IESHPVVYIRQMPNPDFPYLVLESRKYQSVEQSMKLRAERVIQSYRPRYGWMAVGVIAAGAITYAANNDQLFETPLSKTQKNILNITAGTVFLTSLLNMRPYGEPRYTGEYRLLSEVDRVIQTDTTSI